MYIFIIFCIIVFIFPILFLFLEEISVFKDWKYYNKFWDNLDIKTLSKETNKKFNKKSFLTRIKINKIYGVKYIETLLKLQNQQKCYHIIDKVIYCIKTGNHTLLRIKESKSYKDYLSHFKIDISIFSDKDINPNKKSYETSFINIILKDGEITLIIDDKYKISTTNKNRYNELCLIIFGILDKERLRKEREEKKNCRVKEKTYPKDNSNPKLKLLKEKYKLRKEQLNSLNKNDDNYSSLLNELNAYKRAIDRLEVLQTIKK